MPTRPTESARPSRRARLAQAQGLVEILRERVAIARLDTALDAAAVHVDGKKYTVVERDGERLRAAHAAHAARDHELAFETAAEVALGQRGKGLECALQNSLRADVDPAARRHLAVHHQALAIEFVEVLPVGPLAHEIGVGDDDARRHLMRGKHGNRLAGLDQKRLLGPRRSSSRTMAWKHSQLRAARPMPP